MMEDEKKLEDAKPEASEVDEKDLDKAQGGSGGGGGAGKVSVHDISITKVTDDPSLTLTPTTRTP